MHIPPKHAPGPRPPTTDSLAELDREVLRQAWKLFTLLLALGLAIVGGAFVLIRYVS